MSVPCGCLECSRVVMISEEDRESHRKEGLVIIHAACRSPNLQFLTLVRSAMGYALYTPDD